MISESGPASAYLSKTYANIKNAYYFNGRWETFGGINWTVNKHLALSATVINFLITPGLKEALPVPNWWNKKDAASYNGHWMAGSYIRAVYRGAGCQYPLLTGVWYNRYTI